MSKTASIGLLPSSTLFGRLMASIDRLLTASSRIAVRNGDLPDSVSEPENTGFSRTDAIGRTNLPPGLFGSMAPVFPGPLFCATGHRLNDHLRQISPNGNRRNYGFASWHIAYKYAFQRS